MIYMRVMKSPFEIFTHVDRVLFITCHFISLKIVDERHLYTNRDLLIMCYSGHIALKHLCQYVKQVTEWPMYFLLYTH